MATNPFVTATRTSIPGTFKYEVPEKIPDDLQQYRIKIPTGTTLRQNVNLSDQYFVEVPEIANSFLDPSSSRLELNITLRGRFENKVPVTPQTDAVDYRKLNWLQNTVTPYTQTTAQASTTPGNANINNNYGCIAYTLGGGLNLFSRYVCQPNGNVLCDDITCPGILEKYLNNYTSNAFMQGAYEQGRMFRKREDQNASLGIELFDPLSLCLSDYEIGRNPYTGLQDGSYGTAAANTPTEKAFILKRWARVLQWNIVGQGITAYSPTQDITNQTDKEHGRHYKAALLNSLFAPNAIQVLDSNGRRTHMSDPSAATWSYTYGITVGIPGYLGGNGDKYIPMFCGTHRLTFFTNSVDQIFFSGDSRMVLDSYRFNSFQFVGNYVRLGVTTFGDVESQLKVPFTYTIKSSTYSYANKQIPSGVSGQQEFEIPVKRASITQVIMGCQPLAGESLHQTTVYQKIKNMGPIEGNLCSVNPGAGFPTSILINNQEYPTLGLNPTDNANETLTYNIDTLHGIYQNEIRPNFHYLSFLNCMNDVGDNADNISLTPLIGNATRSNITFGDTGNALSVGVQRGEILNQRLQWNLWQGYYIPGANGEKVPPNILAGRNVYDLFRHIDFEIPYPITGTPAAFQATTAGTAGDYPNRLMVNGAQYYGWKEDQLPFMPISNLGLGKTIVGQNILPQYLSAWNIFFDLEVYNRSRTLISGQTTINTTFLYRTFYIEPTYYSLIYHFFVKHDILIMYDSSAKRVYSSI